ncbi:MAG: OmpA family protein [Nitrospinae bacterium]|nr:OmpA family protein [Nitrospinota bacterium]
MGIKTKFEGAPLWTTTFADLSTLLLTFFVLLLSFSNQDIAKFREMLGSVQDAFGVTVERKGEYQAALTGEGDDSKAQAKAAAEELKRQLTETTQAVERAVKKANMNEHAEVSVKDGMTHVRVRGEALFAPGSTKINAAAVPLLDGLAEVLRKTKLNLTVEGHTDNLPVAVNPFTTVYVDNWELSGARAAVIVRYLITKQVSPAQLSAAGYADMIPAAANDTPEGQSKNRRVEFLIRKPK